MAVPLHSELADRIDRVDDCLVTTADLFVAYHSACATQNWKEAERVRVILAESIEAWLDATAAVFKQFDHGKKN